MARARFLLGGHRLLGQLLPFPPPLLLLLLLLLLGDKGGAEGAASGPLLGGAYQPTTDVSHVVTLSQLVHAISVEDATNGTNLYRRASFSASDGSSHSLQGIFDDPADGTRYVDATNNPLYATYMHSLWKSSHGSGGGGGEYATAGSESSQTGEQPRDEYAFLGARVDVYGSTIIENMLAKESGYDPRLTAEAIRAMGVWMAFVQALQNAVSMCAPDANADGSVSVGGAGIGDPGYVSPVDVAAAFWFGSHDPSSSPSPSPDDDDDDGSLYAWSARARSNFDTMQFDANDAIARGLSGLQPMLPECLTSRAAGGGSDADVDAIAGRMRTLADDIVRYATVPMVQNLIHHSARLALGVADTAADQGDGDGTPGMDDAVDWIILYGLSTIAPIRVCDEFAFDDLYGKLVHDAKSEVAVLDDGSGTGNYIESLEVDVLYDVLNTLYGRLACLGLSCGHIGVSNLLAASDAEGATSPTCADPEMEFGSGYPFDDAFDITRHLKIDMDVRTIGILVEMDANEAAYDVYRWGRHMRRIGVDGSTGRDVNDVDGWVEEADDIVVALRALAIEPVHELNSAGAAYASFLEENSGTFTPGLTEFFSLADAQFHEVTMKNGRYFDATPAQRRSIVESTLAFMTAHVHALNRMYEAEESCLSGATETTWDQGFASLTGWAEEDEYAHGFLMMALAGHLCDKTGNCLSDIKSLLVDGLVGGKEMLRGNNCLSAELVIRDTEKLILTLLVDAAAYYADQLSQDGTNADHLADGHVIATALVPQIRAFPNITLDYPDMAEVIERNIGGFGSEAQTLVDGVGVVIDALMDFVAVSGIDCELLAMRQVLCPDFAGGGTTSTSPNVAGGMNMPSPTPFTFNPTTIIGGPDVLPLACGSATDSGLPGKSLMDDPPPALPPALFGGLYQPMSDVDHIVKLTETLDFIGTTMDESDGLNAYTEVEDGISLQCLSMGVQKDFILRTNPLFVIYMYGLWSSEFGSSDPDEWSNKLFFDADVLHYGETIVNDEFNKASGYDGKFTVETIQLMNMWMAMMTEMYRAAGLCRDGARDVLDFNPVDFAAALWFGTAQDADSSTDGSSLYAWAKRAAMDFVEQSISVTDEVNSRLTLLQTTYSDCRALGSGEESNMKGIEMRHMVDEITWLLTVPLVQHFIHHLAVESGVTDQETTNERNHMVLYALSVLPLISICDKATSDDLFVDLITSTKEKVMLDSTTFSNHIGILQDKYKCLGISCEMVGVHTGIDAYPQCNNPNAGDTFFAGYRPNNDESLQLLNIDHDISTMLAFIVMEADAAALDIFHNGRNAKSSDGSNSYLSLDSISNPTEADATGIYASFTSGDNGRNYLDITLHAIEGVDAFSSASVFKKSAGASLAIATINLQMLILLNTYEAVENCSEGGFDYSISWDKAVAAFVGSNEGTESGGSDVNGFLLFQLAQELCAQYDSCGEDGEPLINKKIMELFTVGQEALISGDCDGASVAQAQIESLLQAIVIDLVAYHSKLTELNTEEIHCTMAHVASFALLPMMRRDSATEAVALAADTIEGSIGGEDGTCQILDVEAIYQSLYAYVQFKGIDCAWLGSSVCNGTSTTTDSLGYENNDGYTPSPGNHTLFNEEYEPSVDVTSALALSSVVSAICTADDSTDVAKNAYSSDATIGLTIESMSLDAKYVMSDELQFYQYIYALQDGVDVTDGSRLFDSKPATEYANTITKDALDTNILLGCQSVKVLNIWMWIVHKLNSVVDECRGGSMNSGLVDEAAALWEGGQLYAMAEELGPKFLHDQDGGVTYLNRRILDRLKKARDLTSNIGSSCGDADVHDLRIIVKEIVSYMTAVLIQSLIDSMIAEYDDNKNKVVELMAFAVLPHIKTCGHEVAYNELHDILILASLSEDMISPTIETLQSHYSCLGLSCDDVGRHDGLNILLPECSDITMIAGYLPENATKTNMVARLDLDAVAIHQLTSMEKFELAKRIYAEGHNYYDYDNVEAYNFVSLYNLTQGHTIGYVDFPIYSLYEGYNGPDFSNELITSIFDKTGLFEIATTSQRGLAIKVAISGIVSYMAVLEAFYSAVSRCDTEKTSSIHAFDGAVALLIGSVEGQGIGGSLNEEGQMFYSIAKRNCNHFNDCLGSDSRVNEELFSSLTEGQDAIRQGLCGDATNAVDTINALLKVPLVQSLLYFSDPENVQSEYDAAAYVAMKAVLPTIFDIDPDSAENLKAAMSFDGVSDPDGDAIDVRNSLQVLLSNPNSKIDCELVMIGLCDLGVGDSATDTPVDGVSDTPDDEGVGMPADDVSDTPDDGGSDTPDDVITAPPDVINLEDPTPIPFVTSNYVGDRSAIALDVKQIQSAISANDFLGATQIYNNGRNSKIYNENGIATGELRSIARFSTESASIMKSDPTYNLFIYGLSDDNQEFMGRPTTVYADALISNLLVLQAPEAHTAMVTITIWMQVVHSLHSAYGACRSSISEERSGFSGRNLQRSTDNDPSLFIDEAAAYWMGDNQDTGSFSQGHLLYALTEFIADKFETPSESESTINLKVIDLFNKAKNHIAISRSCSTSEKSHLKLKGIVDELIPVMAVPLLRCLLYHLSKNELTLVKVYATAVLPLFSACASATYRELKSLLIDPSDLSLVSIKKDYVVSQIQSMYSCLGLTCDLVGSMINDDPERALLTSSICDTNFDSKSLAGYKYVAEQEIMDQASLIDIDIRKIEIFLENGMIHFPEDGQDVLSGAAFDLYRYGQQKGNDNDDGSLRSIARSTNRDVVPIFTAFRRYFDNDDYYADAMITSAFQKQRAFSMATPDQRKRFITFSLRYMVTFMAILEKVYLAFKSCSNEETRGEGAKDLDIAIAYYMGSLEGKDDGGSYDGSLIHMLANRMCVHFGTCSDKNNAVINERMISLVYASQGELEMGACTSMERTVKEIEHALIVPLIQGVLFCARENELHFKKKDYWEANQRSSMPEFYPEGYALAQAILPVIAEVDRSAATNIKNVMVVSFPTGFDDANSNDSAKVHRAMKSAVSKMVGLDCSQIGSLGGVGFCASDNEDSYDALNSASRSPYSFAALLIAGVLLVYI